jgi:hypothetical protein
VPKELLKRTPVEILGKRVKDPFAVQDSSQAERMSRRIELPRPPW